MTLAALLERRDICRSLKSLAECQRAALAEGDYDSLIEILGERRGLLDRLAAATEASRDWPASRATLSEVHRRDGDALWNETRALLGDLARAEQEAIADLTARRDATRDELRDIASAGRANAAYRDSLAPITHRSLDVDR